MTIDTDWVAIIISTVAAVLSGSALGFYRRSANAAETANTIAEEAKKFARKSAEESRVANEIARDSVVVSAKSLDLADAQWRDQMSAKIFVMEQRPIMPEQNRKNQAASASQQKDDGLRVTIYNTGSVRAAKIEWLFAYFDDAGTIVIPDRLKSQDKLDPGEHIRMYFVMTSKEFIDASLMRLVFRYYDQRANTLVFDFSKPKGEPTPIRLIHAELNGVAQTNQALAQLTGSLEDIARYTPTIPDGT